MDMEKPKIQTPKPAEKLVRNLERRKGLLARISGQEAADIPDVLIKDTFLKFLDKKYKGLSEEEIKDLNKKLFMFMNRATSIASKKQDTSPITAMYASQYKGAERISESTYGEYKEKIKEIIELCRRYGVPLKSITGMQHGLGVPKTEELDKLLRWCKENKINITLAINTRVNLGIPITEEELLAPFRVEI